jgi:hypothetical protein
MGAQVVCALCVSDIVNLHLLRQFDYEIQYHLPKPKLTTSRSFHYNHWLSRKCLNKL